MCSELFRIPFDWLNQPLVGGFRCGTLIALAIILAGTAAMVWLQRMKHPSQPWAYLPSLLLLAALFGIAPRMFPDGLPIRGYGTMVLLGSLVGLWMASYRARQVGLHADAIISLALGVFVCGIIGARLFFVIEYWPTQFQFDNWQDTLLAIVKFTEGGLVVYGSLIGATLAFLVFTKRHELPRLALADLIAPSLLAGLAFGRIGCLLNGCCFGGETSVPWAVTFPPQSPPYQEQMSNGSMLGFALQPGDAADPRPRIASVEPGSAAALAGIDSGVRVDRLQGRAIRNLAEAQETYFLALADSQSLRLTTAAGETHTIEAPSRSRPVHPTQIYSAIHAALLAWVLWSFYPFRRRDGEVTALMLTIYPVARFLLEMIRIDESAVFGTGLSISQNISMLLLAGAVVMWIYLSRQPRQLATFGGATW